METFHPVQTTLPDAPDLAPPRHDPLHIGLIGLGLMGRGMGFSLLRAGHTLDVVANRRRETADELKAAGAWEAEDPGALAVACDVLVLCLPAVEATEAVLFGPRGVVAGARPGLLVSQRWPQRSRLWRTKSCSSARCLSASAKSPSSAPAH